MKQKDESDMCPPGWPASDETQSANALKSDALSSQMSLKYEIQKELIWIFLVVLRWLNSEVFL